MSGCFKPLIILVCFFLLIASSLSADKSCDRSAASPPGQTAVITILDMDNDGIKTTHYKDGAYFDHDSNGFAEQTGWVDQNDGLLVSDLNNDGTIDSGKEVFGNNIKMNGKSSGDGLLLLKDLHNILICTKQLIIIILVLPITILFIHNN